MYTIVALAILATAAAIPARRDLSKVFPNSIDAEVSGVPHLHHLGAPEEPRIVGGVVATAHSFPYQVALFVPVAGGTTFCGGSVIDNEWILTAAHCIDKRTGKVEVVLGAQDVESVEASQVTFSSNDVYQHPDWNRTILHNDVALVKLPDKIEYNSNIKAVKLPSRAELTETFDGVKATLSGWGKISDGSNTISSALRYMIVPVVENSICHEYFDQVISSHICTSASSGQSACNGDSGGPLVITESDGSKTQVGIVSFGGLSCSRGYPDVYTRVTSFIDWISKTTNISFGN